MHQFDDLNFYNDYLNNPIDKEPAFIIMPMMQKIILARLVNTSEYKKICDFVGKYYEYYLKIDADNGTLQLYQKMYDKLIIDLEK